MFTCAIFVAIYIILPNNRAEEKGESDMLNRIIECENRLLRDRQLLNELTQEYQTGNTSEMVRLKIDELQREVNYMNQQLEILRREYNSKLQMPQTQSANQLQQPVYSATANQSQQPVYSATVMQSQRPQNSVPQMQQENVQTAQRSAYANKQNDSQDMEKTIGKSMMGIFASVLIFISFILFATLVIPYLTDTIKMVMMYVVSFAFAIAGNLLLKKDGKNKWYLSIAGCGVGAVYLSLLVSRIYFNAITDIMLYTGILIWAVVVSVLSRLRSRIFLAIGQTGIWISVVFGVVFCNSVKDTNRLLFLVIYFLMAEAVFYISNMHKEYGKNLLNHIFMAVCETTLLFAVRSEYAQDGLAVTAAMLLMVLAYVPMILGICFFHLKKEDSAVFGILNTIYFWIAMVSFSTHFENYSIVMALMAVMLLFGMECFLPDWTQDRAERFAGKGIFQAVLFVFLYFEVKNTELIWKYSSIAIPAMVCLLYGFGRQKKVYKVAGFIYGLLFMLVPMKGYWYLGWGSVIFIAFILLLKRYKEQYRTWMKISGYPVFILFIFINTCRIMAEIPALSPDMRKWLLLVVPAVVNICMMKIPVLRTNLQTKAEETGFMLETGLIHSLYMLISLFYINYMDSFLMHFLSIMLGILLFTVNINTTLKKVDYKWSSVYVGTKIFIFCLTVMGSFEAPDFLFSIVALLFAIGFIVAGFLAEKRTGKNIKSIRIYGLILSLISIVKLLMLDTHHDNMLAKAVSFFVSGLLCFAISFIYNVVDKRVTQKGK